MARRYKVRSVAYGPPPSFMHRKRGACVRLNVVLSLYVAQLLRETAEREGPNMSAIVEQALVAELRKREVLP